jgi:hypothetical protein
MALRVAIGRWHASLPVTKIINILLFVHVQSSVKVSSLVNKTHKSIDYLG